jgi:hypothetical protein
MDLLTKLLGTIYLLMIIAAREKRYGVTSLSFKIIDAVCNHIRWPNTGEKLFFSLFWNSSYFLDKKLI